MSLEISSAMHRVVHEKLGDAYNDLFRWHHDYPFDYGEHRPANELLGKQEKCRSNGKDGASLMIYEGQWSGKKTYGQGV